MLQEDGNTKNANVFHIGTDRDSSPEFIQEGCYVDASNMEDNNASLGLGKGLSKIQGETVLFSQNTSYTGNAGESLPVWITVTPQPTIIPDAWICIGASTVNDNTVDFWVNTANAFNVIRINGIIMCYTDKMGLTPQFPLQLDVNDSCLGGEIFITDFNIHPYIFNIQDIIDNYYSNPATGLYFSNFNPNNYSVVLVETIDHPVFDSLKNVASMGLKVGKYSYSIRLADVSGNHTNWSIQTPYIPVPKVVGGMTNYGNRTYGDEANLAVNSPFGIVIKFRVNNIAGYDHLDIRRVVQNTGQALDYVPTPQLLTFVSDANGNAVDIKTNPNAVWEFLDETGLAWVDITDTADTDETQSAFSCAKAVRYYNEKLTFGNIKYPSKDVTPIQDAVFIDKTGELGFPVVENIGTTGHKDIRNQVYFPNNQSGEREGFAVEFLDATNSRSFCLPYTTDLATAGHYGMDDVVMPDRRIEMQGDSAEYSYYKWRGAALASDVTHQENLTFERFDLGNLNRPTPDGTGTYAPVKKTNNSTNISIQDGSYQVLTPVKENDTDLSGLNYAINEKAGTTEGADDIIYAPKGFNPRYFSQGMAFNGINQAVLPSWVKGFSIVKKKKAGRVVCQGIGVYDFDPAHPADNNIGNHTGARKFTNSLRFFSPDFMATALFNPKINDFIANPANYSVELVSPLGYFSEVYNANKDNNGALIGNRNDTNLDIISYARLLCNSSTINQGLHNSFGTDEYYTEFGRWRNGQLAPSVYSDPTRLYDISNGIMKTSGDAVIGEQPYMQITFPVDIYASNFISGVRQDTNSQQVRDFHEPFYIVNIIDNGAAFLTNNIQTYEETGHLQKLESIIGSADGKPKTLQLVDERWEDCIPNPFNTGVAEITSTENRYCYVDNKAWINVTYFTSTQINTILDSLMATGVYIDSDGNNCYGVFQNDNIGFTTPNFNLIFSKFQNSTPVNSTLLDKYFLPQVGVNVTTYITVKYDNRVPIKLFSGDSYIGETLFQSIQDSGGYAFINPLPYNMYEVPFSYEIVASIDSVLPIGRYLHLQTDHNLQVGTLRQWVIAFCCESSVDVPMTYSINSIWGGTLGTLGTGNHCNSTEQSFPLVNYVMRPNSPLSNIPDNFGKHNVVGIPFHLIAYEYDRDYPDECQSGRWAYGGFRVNQQFNIDYSKYLNDRSNTSKPLVGFKEQTWFCSRFIYSETRNINQQNSPNLKSFPVLNVFDISDKTQEIKYLFDDDSLKGNNLFALTGKGLCLLLTDKSLIYDTTLAQLAITNPSDTYIQGEMWLTRKFGSNDEMWRGIAEYDNKCFIPNNESVFMLEGYKIQDIVRTQKNEIRGTNIINGTYYSKLYPALAGVLPGYTTPVCAVYNIKDNTYWLKIGVNSRTIESGRVIDMNNPTSAYFYNITQGEVFIINVLINTLVILPSYFNVGDSFILKLNGSFLYHASCQGSDLTTQLMYGGQTNLFTRDTSSYGWNISRPDPNYKAKVYVYSEKADKMAWQGTYDYAFDKMICVKKTKGNNDLRVLGLRDLTTFSLKDGTLINGSPVNGYVIIGIAPQPGMTKELIDILIHSDRIPIRVEFTETADALAECFLDSTTSTLYLKNYRGGFYNQVPRKVAVAPSTSRNRMQNTQFFIKIIHNTVGEFVIREVISGTKLIV